MGLVHTAAANPPFVHPASTAASFNTILLLYNLLIFKNVEILLMIIIIIIKIFSYSLLRQILVMLVECYIVTGVVLIMSVTVTAVVFIVFIPFIHFLLFTTSRR